MVAKKKEKEEIKMEAIEIKREFNFSKNNFFLNSAYYRTEEVLKEFFPNNPVYRSGLHNILLKENDIFHIQILNK